MDIAILCGIHHQNENHSDKSSDSYLIGDGSHDALNETLENFKSLSPVVIEICKWLAYIIPFVAILFNSLSIGVFLQRRLGKAPVSNFLIALAVSDTLAVTAVFHTAYVR